METRKIRDIILNGLKEELLGPGSEKTGVCVNEEIITDRPSKRYVTGILFNKADDTVDNELNESGQDENIEQEEIDEQEEKQEEFKKTLMPNGDSKSSKNEYESINDEYFEDMNNAHIIRKSTMGLTFFVDKNLSEIKVHLSAARYNAVRLSECMVKYTGDIIALEDKDIGSFIFYEDEMLKLKNRFEQKDIKRWKELGLFEGREELEDSIYKLSNQCSKYRLAYKRKEIVFKNPFVIKFEGNQGKLIIEEEELKIFALKRKFNEKYSITLMLINEAKSPKEEKYLFQPQISVNSLENNFKFQESNNINETINPELDLLYRNRKSYGVGHGVSVDFIDIDSMTGEGTIRTDYLPTYEVANTNFEIPKISGLIYYQCTIYLILVN